MKKATQNTALPKMKLILSPKGLFKKTEKYYFVIVAVCNTVTLFHYTGTEKKGKRRKREKRKKGATEIAPFAVATKTRRFPLLVEVTGLEPTTSWSRTKRATKLRYTS